MHTNKLLLITLAYCISFVNGLSSSNTNVNPNKPLSPSENINTERDYLNHYLRKQAKTTKRAPIESVPAELSTNHQKGILVPSTHDRVLSKRALSSIKITNDEGWPMDSYNDNDFDDDENEVSNCIKKTDSNKIRNGFWDVYYGHIQSKQSLCSRLLHCIVNSAPVDVRFSEDMIQLARIMTGKLIPHCDIDNKRVDENESSNETPLNLNVVGYRNMIKGDEKYWQKSSKIYPSTDKRAPWAGAERRYDSLLSVLGARLSERKRSSDSLLRNREDSELTQKKDTPENRVKIFPFRNGLKDYFQQLSHSSGYYDNNKENLDSPHQPRLIKSVRIKRDPENVVDGGGVSQDEFTEGTLGNYAADMALDAYASLLQTDHGDLSDKTRISRQIRPFVG